NLLVGLAGDGAVRLGPGEDRAEEVLLVVTPVLLRRGSPGRGAWETEPARGRLHRRVLRGRDVEGDAPHSGCPKEVVAGRPLAPRAAPFRCARGRGWFLDGYERAEQEAGGAGQHGRPGEEPSAHRNTSRVRVRRDGGADARPARGPVPGLLPLS